MTDLPVVHVPLNELEHVRTLTSPSKLAPVAAGMRAGTQLPPIWVSRWSPDDPWELADGNHRLAAARELGHSRILAVASTGPEQIAAAEQMWSEGRIGLSETDIRGLEPTRQRGITLAAQLSALLEGATLPPHVRYQ